MYCNCSNYQGRYFASCKWYPVSSRFLCVGSERILIPSDTVGDSTAVLAYQNPEGTLTAKRISRDHKPTGKKKKKKRIHLVVCRKRF